jgi:hypothetical protein
MEQGASCGAVHGIPCLLGNLVVINCLHKNMALVIVLRQTNPGPTLLVCTSHISLYAICTAHSIFDVIILWCMAKSTNYEVPQCAISSSLLLLQLP